MRPLTPASIVERIRSLTVQQPDCDDTLERRLAPYTISETSIRIPSQRAPQD